MLRCPELLGLGFFGQTEFTYKLELQDGEADWTLDRKYSWLEPFYNIYDAFYLFMFTMFWPLNCSEVVTQIMPSGG